MRIRSYRITLDHIVMKYDDGTIGEASFGTFGRTFKLDQSSAAKRYITTGVPSAAETSSQPSN